MRIKIEVQIEMNVPYSTESAAQIASLCAHVGRATQALMLQNRAHRPTGHMRVMAPEDAPVDWLASVTRDGIRGMEEETDETE